MCVGIPMQVRQLEPGFAIAEGRGEIRRISTLLLGTVEKEDWLLVFLSDARERITCERAQQINETLDLVSQAMSGQDAYQGPSDRAGDDADLPSAMTVEQLDRMTRGR